MINEAEAWTQEIQKAEERAKNISAILNRITDEAILPCLKRRYDSTGIKTHSGMLYRGITERGAPGNYVNVEGNAVTVGISYDRVKYARFVLEGRGPVRARNAKALRFVIGGQVIFRKSVGPAPPHPVYVLDDECIAKAGEVAAECVNGK